MNTYNVGDTVKFTGDWDESATPWVIDSICINGDDVIIADKEKVNVCHIPLIEGHELFNVLQKQQKT